MCSVGGVGMSMMMISGIAQGYGAMQQGKQQRQLSERNAAILEAQARGVEEQGVEAEGQLSQQTAQLISRQKVQQAAKGISLDSPYASELEENTLIQKEADAMRIRGNYGSKAAAIAEQADITREGGRYAEEAGRYAFASSLFGGLGKGLSNKWFANDSSASQSDIGTYETTDFGDTPLAVGPYNILES